MANKRGRPEGSVNHVFLTIEELKKYVGSETKIPISIKWAKNLGLLISSFPSPQKETKEKFQVSIQSDY